VDDSENSANPMPSVPVINTTYTLQTYSGVSRHFDACRNNHPSGSTFTIQL
jgi:hypothetical protein